MYLDFVLNLKCFELCHMDHHLLLNMDRSQNVYNNYDDYPPTKCKVTLKNKDLWKRFHELETEMIITKSGRRMFPSLHVQITDLDPHGHYCILLEMSPATHCRYKYSSSRGWAPAGAEEAQSPQRIYLHPESPATGDYWMSQPVSFGRLKLTNTQAPPVGHVVLSSMHKYQPRIIITKTSDPRAIAWAPSSSIVFPETQFIAVTAYQNEKITKLKIDNNPFAKGFRENGQSKCKRKRMQAEETYVEDKTVKDPPCTKAQDPSCTNMEEDRISLCSSTSAPSPEIAGQRGSLSPVADRRSTQIYPLTHTYDRLLPHAAAPVRIYPYYYPPYSVYPTPVWGPAPPFYYQYSLPSPTVAEDLTVQPPVEKTSRKLTDFSIRAITGCS